MKNEIGWKDPCKKIRQVLGDGESVELLQRFEDYREAVNVLKHGEGRAFRSLAERKERLPFRIKSDDTECDEGDVAAGEQLIVVDDSFVVGCVETVEEIVRVVSEAQT